MAGIGGFLKIGEVTIHAVVADSVKPKWIVGSMALVALKGCMHLSKWESILLMEFGYLINLPIFGGMASFAIGTHGLLVDIPMAGYAVCRSAIENQRWVAGTAIDEFVTSFQWEAGTLVVKNRLILKITSFNGSSGRL